MTPYYVVMRIGIAESVAYRPPIASTKVLREANVDPALPPGRYAERQSGGWAQWKRTWAPRPGSRGMIGHLTRSALLLASMVSIIIAGGAAVRPF